MNTPTAAVRELVLERDDYHCLGCGQDVRGVRWYSLQHRRARGQGGKNTADNLVTACGSATTGCHWVMEQRAEEMIARGFVVWSWQDPQDVPVVLWTGKAVYLTPDGLYREAA